MPLSVASSLLAIVHAHAPRFKGACSQGCLAPAAKSLPDMTVPGGSYVLLTSLDRERTITVGALGERTFAAGAYAYVGSAMGGLDARIARHLRADKRLHWHIDYLLAHARVIEVVRVASAERLECRIAAALAERLEPVRGFGCSDCACASHLFRAGETMALRAAVAAVVAAAVESA